MPKYRSIASLFNGGLSLGLRSGIPASNGSLRPSSVHAAPHLRKRCPAGSARCRDARASRPQSGPRRLWSASSMITFLGPFSSTEIDSETLGNALRKNLNGAGDCILGALHGFFPQLFQLFGIHVGRLEEGLRGSHNQFHDAQHADLGARGPKPLGNRSRGALSELRAIRRQQNLVNARRFALLFEPARSRPNTERGAPLPTRRSPAESASAPKRPANRRKQNPPGFP